MNLRWAPVPVQVWELASGCRRHVLGPHGGIVPGLAVSPGRGRLLATACGDGHLRLWCTQTGRCLKVGAVGAG